MEYLEHYGIKGQKWGIRRYQNEDGTLTAEGRKRYDQMEKWENSKSGQRRIERFKRAGKTEEDAWTDYKMNRGALIGGFLGGIGGALIGATVSYKRCQAGREFTKQYFDFGRELNNAGLDYNTRQSLGTIGVGVVTEPKK